MAKEKKVKEKKAKQKKDSYIKEVRGEMKKVSWPTRKDVIKYTLATLLFCLIIAGFFQLLQLGLALVKEMFS